MSVLVPELADLGFVTENIISKLGIFQILLDIQIYLFKWSCPMYSFSENNGGKLPEQEALVFQFLLQKCFILLLWYLWHYYSYMFEPWKWVILTYPYSKMIGFITICFTNWDLGSFSQGELLHDCSEQRSCMDFHVSLFHILGLNLRPKKVQSIPFLEHLHKFNLDLCGPRYRNSPQVSCLGMNLGRCWNPNLEGSYLL